MWGCHGATDISQCHAPAACNTLAHSHALHSHLVQHVLPPSAEASFSSCAPRAKPSFSCSLTRALKARPKGPWASSKQTASTHVAPVCTWPMYPSASCLEQENIIRNELCSWAQAADSELCTLLSLSHLLPSYFPYVSGWLEWNCTRVGKQKACTEPPWLRVCSCPASSQTSKAGLAQPHRNHYCQAKAEPKSATAVSGAYPASYPLLSMRSDSGPSQCHRGERLKDTKPSGSPGTKEACKHSLASTSCWLQGLHAHMLKWRTLAIYSSKH